MNKKDIHVSLENQSVELGSLNKNIFITKNALPSLELRTNLRHPYDYCFSRSASIVFLRVYDALVGKKLCLTRRAMFAWLKEQGIQTVPNDTVENLLKKYDPAHGVVVYIDEQAQRGNGKVWVSAKQAQELYANYWCSLFIPPSGRTIRHFQFGDRAFTIPFYSSTDWRSNRGASTSYAVEGSRWSLFPKIVEYPYFAVDFIPGTDMATDFQFVPGLDNDRLENWMQPREMYQALQRATKVLLERGTINGSKASGYGLVFKNDLNKNDLWLEELQASIVGATIDYHVHLKNAGLSSIEGAN